MAMRSAAGERASTTSDVGASLPMVFVANARALAWQLAARAFAFLRYAVSRPAAAAESRKSCVTFARREESSSAFEACSREAPLKLNSA